MSISERTAMFKIVKTELAKLDNLGFDSYQDCLLAIFDEPDFLHVWDFSEVPVGTCQLISDYRNLFWSLRYKAPHLVSGLLVASFDAETAKN